MTNSVNQTVVFLPVQTRTNYFCCMTVPWLIGTGAMDKAHGRISELGLELIQTVRCVRQISTAVGAINEHSVMAFRAIV